MEEFRYPYRDKVIKVGEIYHITQRAPGSEQLFVEDNDYLTMLSLLKEWHQEFKLDILAFCLMPNHYHLLLKINLPNLSEAMHSLNTSYAVRFNLKYQRKGHVFCGVYRASLCLDDVHLIGSSIYIHLNPQKAKLIENSLDYRWSSIKTYINSEIRSFVKNEFVLRIIDEDIKNAYQIYRDMMIKYSSLNYGNIIENPLAVINFSKSIFKSLLGILNNKKLNGSFIAKEFELDRMIEEFRKKKRKNTIEEKRAILYLIEQLKSRGFNTTETAKILNTSRQALYKLTNQVEP
ncbi:MAG: transposase [Candidatus Omnitrophica bacterium]|nr:transposase [Candidatus Omnitrophota bacterium]